MKFQDKYEHLTKNDKFLFLQSIPDLLKEKSKSHSIFFTTFTFKIPSIKISDTSDEVYKDFFRLFRLKLDQSLLSNNKQFENRPIMLLFPEKSKVKTPNHFHGFTFIHSSTMQKFHKNCVANVSKEKISKLNDLERDNFTLRSYMLDSLIKRAPKSSQNQMQCISEQAKNAISLTEPPLTIDNHKMYLISDLKDFDQTTYYSAKHFISSADDYVLECKRRPSK